MNGNEGVSFRYKDGFRPQTGDIISLQPEEYARLRRVETGETFFPEYCGADGHLAWEVSLTSGREKEEDKCGATIGEVLGECVCRVWL